MLKDCDGRMDWPRRGVYFFFEDGEFRPDGKTPRVVRVGTHAVSRGSKTKLWNRLAAHRGTQTGGGNHRGSIFRLHVGGALLRRDDTLSPKPETWARGQSAPKTIRKAEAHVEQAVSAYIGSMPFLWVDANDEPGPSSVRRIIEKNSISLLSCCSSTGETADPPSKQWLGHLCPNETLRRSGLWNVNDVEGEYDPAFLDVLEHCARGTGVSGNRHETIALVSCVKSKVPGRCRAKDLYTSPLFRYMRAYAERHADRWFILSARYGLVDPEKAINSYEQTLNGTAVAERREWAGKVKKQMRESGLFEDRPSFLWLAGNAYKKELASMLPENEHIDPLAGMGIGKRMSWLKAQAAQPV